MGAKRWVVGFDGSTSSKFAARWALDNARDRAESVDLVQAWSVAATAVYSATAPLVLPETTAAVQEAARSTLEEFAAELAADAPVAVTTTLRHGDASSVLLETSADSAQLVVGARGAGRFERLLLGSTSTRCATHATVPTIVVREAAGAAQHLVVAFDGSPNATDAVGWACSFARPGSTIEIIGVWEFAPSLFGTESFHYPEALAEASRQFDEQTEGLRGAARRDDVEITASFLEGRPRDRIAQRAAEADLLVVGARGRGGIGSALLGSVSTWLLHHVQRPVAVIPRREPTEKV